MATDFFDHQLVARKRTSLLIGYFILAVVLIILAVYGVATACLIATTQGQAGISELWDWERLALVATGVSIVILAGSLYKTATLREGGSAIARLLGGELVNPGAATPAQRRLLNIVEEMAIASGTPVPSVYVLKDETSINAFAAGHEPGDAVIAVSQGSLDHLNRDELQGVIAHEFSHILNGDMRLNLRLIGLLHGILLIALIGYTIMRVMGNSSSSSRSRSKDDEKGNGSAMAIFLMGVGLMAVGYVGVFFGRLIKSAISRQREFLADASAVQFTRNPDGIAGALKKIGGLASGSQIQNQNAEQACHMFFGPGVSFWTEAMATHPPLVERIRRIDPNFDGVFPTIDADEVVRVAQDDRRGPPLQRFAPEPAPRSSLAASVGRASEEVPFNPKQAVASVGTTSGEHIAFASALLQSLPEDLAATAREPFGARAVVYALLLDHDPAIRERQLGIVEDRAEPGTVQEVLRVAPLVDALDDRARLPLADLAIPALRQLSLRQYQSFRDRIDPLIRADQKRSLFEFTLQRMLLRHLDRHFDQPPPNPVRFPTLRPLVNDCIRVLSTLSRLGGRNEAEAMADFAQGVQALGLPPEGVRLAPAEECSMVALDRTLDRLAMASSPIKKRVLDACATCIAADGLVTIAEAELLRAIADSLDCPMPPLLPPSSPDPNREGPSRATSIPASN
ncbi:M48 family metallopeptidase [Singulisphaera acidiphila]|uniref:Zn-dependent protease with chaperone function n=1 Tax=Singulisphaera acidiphila (strain ATCC BAA-1392 / DSM 18658 / VKM B-2454 / MOB10) TaxID=886293 RepID=L0DMF9_SINAD|nr:M48 family metallopeptidase [Singulisphaera acidiphila]AGA30569.1 Zn-dependent protease with chaperone function [Singulisphaera acidiphila DSM 18658]